MISFAKNEKSVEMSNIRVFKYKNVGIDLKGLKKFDIKEIVQGGSQVHVYPHDLRTYCFLFVDASRYGITRVIMDSDKKIISRSKTTFYHIYQFIYHKNNIFVEYCSSFNGRVFIN